MFSRGLFAVLIISIIQRHTNVPRLFAVAQSGTSVCRQYHRINETREESFVEEYYKNVWGSLVLATRINFRTKIIPKWIMVEMCCEGYEPSQHDENPAHCVPVCPSGCENGVCQHPNSCVCNPGYEASVDNVTRISECLPQCSSGCVGGKCIAPEKCSCDVGYELVDDSTGCKPMCIEPDAGGPENCGDEGICVAPDECQCRDGYGPANWMSEGEEMANRTKPIYHHIWEVDCLPICEKGCPQNAVCNAPNTCSCNDGYKPAPDGDNVTECLPHCERPCHNGFCTHPNICQCNDGYAAHESLGSSYCEPVCPEDCVNGKCINPNQCQCLDGYEYLIAQSDNETKVSANVCIPSCVGDCGHGTCVAPNQCHCDPGYALKTVGSWVHRHRFYGGWQSCMPVCEPSCKEESQCIAPNECSCEPGHDRAINSSSCKPSCSAIEAGGPENCGEQGVCVAPNECQCRDGYAPLHWMTQAEADYGTYHRTKPIFTNRWDIDCFPACENPCPKNAACIAPNTCHCVTGYRPNDFHSPSECLPVCESACNNGFCAHPNVCQCHDGYKNVKIFGLDFCEPICKDGCVHGTCVAPNECECSTGYGKSFISSGNETKLSPNVCDPICYPECGNGICVAPFECDCNPGYVLRNSLYDPDWSVPKSCQPLCDPLCHDELFCAAPNSCQLLDPNPAHLPTFKVKIVEFPSKECGHAGSFSEQNSTCMCNYQSDVNAQCIEPFLCAVIILNGAQSAEKFSLLERVVVLDRTNDISELYRSTMACQNECRISIFSNESLEDIRNETEQCYAMSLHDLQTGLMFNVPQNLLLISERNTNNGSFICFVNSGFRCSSPSYDARKISRAHNTGVIAGAVFLIALIIALALSIYVTRRKIRKIFIGSPQKDEDMMNRSEAMDSPFHTDDVSHL